jgi:hypothetical protein
MRTVQINDDKAFLIIAFYYPLLLVLNLAIAGALRIFGIGNYRIFIRSFLLLLVLLIPVLVICRHFNLIG